MRFRLKLSEVGRSNIGELKGYGNSFGMADGEICLELLCQAVDQVEPHGRTKLFVGLFCKTNAVIDYVQAQLPARKMYKGDIDQTPVLPRKGMFKSVGNGFIQNK